MEKHKNLSAWTEVGYNLFAREGLDGIQIERLARILGLNKSGFYHYFGDMEGFCTELISLHKKKIGSFLQEVYETIKLDPDYIYLLIKYSETVMFQVHLTRSPNHSFYAASGWVDQKLNHAVRRLWCDYMEVPVDSDVGIRYFAVVRDMFYTRITFQNFNYTFLHDLVTNVKGIIDEISDRRAIDR